MDSHPLQAPFDYEVGGVGDSGVGLAARCTWLADFSGGENLVVALEDAADDGVEGSDGAFTARRVAGDGGGALFAFSEALPS